MADCCGRSPRSRSWVLWSLVVVLTLAAKALCSRVGMPAAGVGNRGSNRSVPLSPFESPHRGCLEST